MSVYPSGIDSFNTKVDNVDDVLAADVNSLQDSVVAIETTLGINPSLFTIAKEQHDVVTPWNHSSFDLNHNPKVILNMFTWQDPGGGETNKFENRFAICDAGVFNGAESAAESMSNIIAVQYIQNSRTVQLNDSGAILDSGKNYHIAVEYLY